MLFFLIALSILTAIYGYVGWRSIRPARLAPTWKTLLWAILAGLWALPLLPISLRRFGNEDAWVDQLAWVAYSTLGFFVLAFTLLVLADLARLLLPAFRFLIRLTSQFLPGAGAEEAPVDLVRRSLLAYPVNLGILGVAGAMTGYGISEAIQLPHVVRVKVPLPNLPRELEGFRIAQLTDIHIGPMIKQDFIGKIVDQTNALAPDLIALTGDLVDGSVPHLKDAVSPLSSLAARHGTFFVTGNHEYYSGAEHWIEEVDRLGMRVLLNDHLTLQSGDARILVAGVTDPTGRTYVKGHEPDLNAAIAGAPISGPTAADVKLLLAHQPRAVFDAARAGFDLQLSGHTHGGQFFPWNFVVGLTQPYLKGLHLHQNTWIYVSMGTGFWGPPLRLGTHSEIALIELTRGDKPDPA